MSIWIYYKFKFYPYNITDLSYSSFFMSKKKGKKGKAQEQDDSTQQIMRFYSRKISSLGLAQNKIFANAVA